MKPNRFLAAALLGGLLAAGCQTAGGPAGSPELKAAQSAALQRQRLLEQRLAAHLAAQTAISNQADRIHVELLDSAQTLRDIKQQANLVSVAAQTNRLALEALRGELDQHRRQIEELEKKAREEGERIKALQDALSREQQVRQQEAAELKAAAERQAAEERKKADALREALAREAKLRDQAVAAATATAAADAGRKAEAAEKKAGELQAALTREQAAAKAHEQEIAQLRQALADREKTLRAQTARAEAPAADAAASAVRQVAAGNAALAKGRHDEAEKLFKEALVAAPGMVGARVGLAACRYERGALDEAEDIVNAVLKEDRRNAQALGLRGLLCWRRGQLEDAEDVLTLAIREQKEDSQLRNYLGIVLYERKKFEGAVAALRKAVEIDPANAEARYNLSVVLAMMPEPDLAEARTQYRKAVELGSAKDEAMEKILAPVGAAQDKS